MFLNVGLSRSPIKLQLLRAIKWKEPPSVRVHLVYLPTVDVEVMEDLWETMVGTLWI
jgi:hypothetical protein